MLQTQNLVSRMRLKAKPPRRHRPPLAGKNLVSDAVRRLGQRGREPKKGAGGRTRLGLRTYALIGLLLAERFGAVV